MSAPVPGKTREEIEANVKKYKSGGYDRPGGSKEALDKVAVDHAKATGTKPPTDHKLLTTKTGGGGNRPAPEPSGGGGGGGRRTSTRRTSTSTTTTTQQGSEVTGSNKEETKKGDSRKVETPGKKKAARVTAPEKPKDPAAEGGNQTTPNFFFHGGARNPLDFVSQSGIIIPRDESEEEKKKWGLWGDREKKREEGREIIRKDGKSRDGKLRNPDGTLKNPDGLSKNDPNYGVNLGVPKDSPLYDPIVGYSGGVPVYASESATKRNFALTSHAGRDPAYSEYYNPDDPDSPGYNPIVRVVNGVPIRAREVHGVAAGTEHGLSEDQLEADPEASQNAHAKNPDIVNMEDKLGARHIAGDLYVRPPVNEEDGYTLVNTDNEVIIDNHTGRPAEFKDDKEMHRILRNVYPDEYKTIKMGGVELIPRYGHGGSAESNMMIKDGKWIPLSDEEYKKEVINAWEAQEPEIHYGHKLEYDHSPDPEIGFHWRVTDPEGNLVKHDGKPFFTDGAALDNFFNKLPAKPLDRSDEIPKVESFGATSYKEAVPAKTDIGGGYSMLDIGHEEGSNRGITILDKDNNKVELDGKDFFTDTKTADQAAFAHHVMQRYGVDAVPPNSRRGEKANWTLRNESGNIITKDGEIFRPQQADELLEFVKEKDYGAQYAASDPLGLPYAHATKGTPVLFDTPQQAEDYSKARAGTFSPLFALLPDGKTATDVEGNPIMFHDPDERQEWYEKNVNKDDGYVNVLDPTGKPAVGEDGKEIRIKKDKGYRYAVMDKFDTMFTNGRIVTNIFGNPVIGADGAEMIVPTRNKARAIQNLRYYNLSNYSMIDAETREAVRNNDGSVRTFSGPDEALEFSKKHDYILVPPGVESLPQGYDTWDQYRTHAMQGPTRPRVTDGLPPALRSLNMSKGVLPPSPKLDDVASSIDYMLTPLKSPESRERLPERDYMYDSYEALKRDNLSLQKTTSDSAGWVLDTVQDAAASIGLGEKSNKRHTKAGHQYNIARFGGNATDIYDFGAQLYPHPKADINPNDYFKGTSEGIDGMVVIGVERGKEGKAPQHAASDWFREQFGENTDVIESDTPGVVFAPIGSDTHNQYLADLKAAEDREKKRLETIGQLVAGVEKGGDQVWRIARPEGGYYRHSDGSVAEFPNKKTAHSYIATHGESIPYHEKYHNVFVDAKGGVIYNKDGTVRHVLNKDYPEFIEQQQKERVKQLKMQTPEGLDQAQREAKLERMVAFYNNPEKPQWQRDALSDDILRYGGYIDIPGKPGATDDEKKEYWDGEYKVGEGKDAIGHVVTQVAKLTGPIIGPAIQNTMSLQSSDAAYGALVATGVKNPTRSEVKIAASATPYNAIENMALSVASLTDDDIEFGSEAADIPMMGLVEHQKFTSPAWHAEREKYGPDVLSQRSEFDKYLEQAGQSRAHAIHYLSGGLAEIGLSLIPMPGKKVGGAIHNFIKLSKGRPIFSTLPGQTVRTVYHDVQDSLKAKVANKFGIPVTKSAAIRGRFSAGRFGAESEGPSPLFGQIRDEDAYKFNLRSDGGRAHETAMRNFANDAAQDKEWVDKMYNKQFVQTASVGSSNDVEIRSGITFNDAYKKTVKQYNRLKKQGRVVSDISVEKGGRATMTEGNIMLKTEAPQVKLDNPNLDAVVKDDRHLHQNLTVGGRTVDVPEEITKVWEKITGKKLNRKDASKPSTDIDLAISGPNKEVRARDAYVFIDMLMKNLNEHPDFKPKYVSGKGTKNLVGQEVDAHAVEYTNPSTRDKHKTLEVVDAGDPPVYDSLEGKILAKTVGEIRIHGIKQAHDVKPFDIKLGRTVDSTNMISIEEARKPLDLSDVVDVEREVRKMSRFEDPAFISEATHRSNKDAYNSMIEASRLHVLHREFGDPTRAQEYLDHATKIRNTFMDEFGWDLMKGNPEPGKLLGRRGSGVPTRDIAKLESERLIEKPVAGYFEGLKGIARSDLGKVFDDSIDQWKIASEAKARLQADDLYKSVDRIRGPKEAQRQKDLFLSSKTKEINDRHAKLKADKGKRIDTTSKTYDKIIDDKKSDVLGFLQDDIVHDDLGGIFRQKGRTLPTSEYARGVGTVDGLLRDTQKKAVTGIKHAISTGRHTLGEAGITTNLHKRYANSSKRIINRDHDWAINKLKKHQPDTRWTEKVKELDDKKAKRMEQLMGTSKVPGSTKSGDINRFFQIQYNRYKGMGHTDAEARKFARTDAEDFAKKEVKKIEAEYEKNLKDEKAKHKIWKKQYLKDMDELKTILRKEINSQKEIDPNTIVETVGSILRTRGLGISIGTGGTVAFVSLDSQEAEAAPFGTIGKQVQSPASVSQFKPSQFGQIAQGLPSAASVVLRTGTPTTQDAIPGTSGQQNESIVPRAAGTSPVQRILRGGDDAPSIPQRGPDAPAPRVEVTSKPEGTAPRPREIIDADRVSSMFSSKPSGSTTDLSRISAIFSKPSDSAPSGSTTSVMSMLSAMSKPSGSFPSGSKPSLPSLSRPSGSKPSEPSGSKPSEPSGSKPSGSKPSGSKPSGSKPSGSKPSGSKPSGSKPSGSKPSGSKPSGSKPSGSKPSVSKPSISRPISPIRTLLTPDLDEREAPQKKKDEKGPLFQTNVFANTFIGSRIDAPEITRNPKGHNILRSTERKSVFTGKVDNKLTGIFGTGPPKTPAAPRPAATGPPGYKPKPVAPKKAAESILASTVVPKSKKAKKKKGDEEEVPEGQGLAGLIGGVPTSSGGVIQPGGGLAALGGSGGGIAGLGTATADDVPKAGKRTGKGMPGLVDSGAGKTGADMGMGTTNLGMGSGKGTGRMQGADLGMGKGGSDLGLGGGKKPSNLLDGLGGVPGLKRRRKGLI